MQDLLSGKPIQCSRETSEGTRTDTSVPYEEAKAESNLNMDLDLITYITGLEIIEDRETDSESDSIEG
jgi:hypothetical protein